MFLFLSHQHTHTPLPVNHNTHWDLFLLTLVPLAKQKPLLISFVWASACVQCRVFVWSLTVPLCARGAANPLWPLLSGPWALIPPGLFMSSSSFSGSRMRMWPWRSKPTEPSQLLLWRPRPTHTHTPSLPSLNVTEKLLQPLLSRTLIPWLSFSKLHSSRLPVPVRLTSHASLHFLPYLSVCLSDISLSVKTLGFNTLPVCISAHFQSPIRGAITVLLINLGVDFNGIICHPATSLALH